MTTISQVLDRKGTAVLGIDEDATLHAAVQTMARHGIGSLAVRHGNTIIGILSERDVVLRLASHAGGVMVMAVRDAMHAIHTVEWNDEVRHAMTLMTDRQVRHLLVQRDGVTVGLVSIGDLVKDTIAEQEGAITRLHHYITGQPD
ncbi:MAG TPA: CBS domain-containing protein [Planctomycetota bacterium]|nr:CBS domain-containing protein [Planctomycetota bacterium]